MFNEIFEDRPGRNARLQIFSLAAILALSSLPVAAGTISIGEGASINTGSGQIELGCGDAEIAGALAGSLTGADNVSFGPGAATDGAFLSLSGDWINNGPRALNALVDWRDGCSVSLSRMLGSSNLDSLTISTSSGRDMRFDATGEQRVSSSLSLTGTSGQPLRLRSTASGEFASVSLADGASQLIDSVDVAYIDSSAGQGIAPGTPADFDSQRSGPVRNWFMAPPVPVSTLGLTSTLLLIALLGLIGLKRQRLRLSRTQGVSPR